LELTRLTTLSTEEAVDDSELYDEEVVASNFEALFTDGWMAYTTRNKHFGLPAGTPCAVKFVTQQNGRVGVDVRFKATAVEANDSYMAHYGALAGRLPAEERYQHFAKRTIWYWPGLEDTVIACNLYESAHCAMRPY
jgi:hypothetical protein